jgi:predicted MFS family arabinose efflux permease
VIVLYESALGIGIALGPLIGGVLGNISWRGPFFGVSVLMAIALIATVFFLPKTPKPVHKQRLSEPLAALKHKALRNTSIVGLLYNWAFFTLLGYSPFLMGINSPILLGLVFCGWGILVAIFAVWGAPFLQRRFGTAKTLYVNFVVMALDLAIIAVFYSTPTVVIVCVVVAGAFIGVNNTLVTTAVMSIAPVERPVASATYGFVRFIGGGLAPFVAGLLVTAFNPSVPFFLGTATLVAAAIVLSTVHNALAAADRGEIAQPVVTELDQAENDDPFPGAVGIGNAD